MEEGGRSGGREEGGERSKVYYVSLVEKIFSKQHGVTRIFTLFSADRLTRRLLMDGRTSPFYTLTRIVYRYFVRYVRFV